MNRMMEIGGREWGQSCLSPAERKSCKNRTHSAPARVIRIRRLAFMMAAVLLLSIFAVPASEVRGKSALSSQVLKYKKTITEYAKREGISKYRDTLLAIMMVESGGRGKDVMQCSESLGLPRNTLGTKASIKQSCKYFSSLVKIARAKRCDTNSIIQAYNFGPGYLYYVARHGRKHKEKLAIAFSKKYSKGKKYRYLNSYAIKKNGGWLYGYGNMFYVAMVKKYL